MKKFLSIVLILVFCALAIVSCKKKAEPVYSGAVMLYAEVDEEIAKEIKSDFEQTYKGVVLDYFYGSFDRMKEKISEGYEIDSTPEADVILLSSKNKMAEILSNSWVEPYTSNEDKKVLNEYKNKEGYSPAFLIDKGDNIIEEYEIALLKGALNKGNGELLIDYLLSKKGQEKLASLGFKSVRKN